MKTLLVVFGVTAICMAQSKGPAQLKTDSLGPAFAQNSNPLMIAGARFTYHISVPELLRLPDPGVDAFVKRGGFAARMASDMMGAAVARVRQTPDGKYTYDIIEGKAASVYLEFGGRPLDPTSLSGKLLFGPEYVKWSIQSGKSTCMVELKDVVLVVGTQELHGGASTAIRSSDCWFPAGRYEFKGEAQLGAEYLTLLAGAEYRLRGDGPAQ